MHPSSSQAKEMADESMVRNLAAQAEAIWPQEEPIFDRHPLHGAVIDAGCGTFAPRVQFQHGDALALPFDDASFDFAISRHVIQAVPWCHPTEHDSDGFCQVFPPRFGAAVGCDLNVGRKTFTLLHLRSERPLCRRSAAPRAYDARRPCDRSRTAGQPRVGCHAPRRTTRGRARRASRRRRRVTTRRESS